MAPRVLPPRDAKGRYTKRQDPPLPPELVQSLGQDRRVVQLLADKPLMLRLEGVIRPTGEMPWRTHGPTTSTGDGGQT
jgi:hypothetical protein